MPVLCPTSGTLGLPWEGHPQGHHLTFHSRAESPSRAACPPRGARFFRVIALVLTRHCLCRHKSGSHAHWATRKLPTTIPPVVRRSLPPCLGGEPCQWIWGPLHPQSILCHLSRRKWSPFYTNHPCSEDLTDLLQAVQCFLGNKLGLTSGLRHYSVLFAALSRHHVCLNSPHSELTRHLGLCV